MPPACSIALLRLSQSKAHSVTVGILAPGTLAVFFFYDLSFIGYLFHKPFEAIKMLIVQMLQVKQKIAGSLRGPYQFIRLQL
jgi:hypothetical protein